MKIISPDDLYPKRFPRKTKKKYIQAWGRDVYKGLLKGTYILLKTYPYTLPNRNGRMYPYDAYKKGIMSRYAETEINPDLYCIYKYKKE